MAESFASYLAKNYVAKKGFQIGTVPEAQKLKSNNDIILTRADGLSFEIICIVDAESDPRKRFTLSIGDVETIGKQCTKYAGRVHRTKMPVAIRIFEVSSLPIDSNRPEDMKFYGSHSALTSVIIDTAYIDTISKTVFMNAPFNGLLKGRPFIEKLPKTPRESDASLQKAVTAQSAIGQKAMRLRVIDSWATYLLLAVFVGVFGAEQYFAVSPAIGFFSPSVRTLVLLGALHKGLVVHHHEYFVSSRQSFCIPVSFI